METADLVLVSVLVLGLALVLLVLWRLPLEVPEDPEGLEALVEEEERRLAGRVEVDKAEAPRLPAELEGRLTVAAHKEAPVTVVPPKFTTYLPPAATSTKPQPDMADLLRRPVGLDTADPKSNKPKRARTTKATSKPSRSTTRRHRPK